MASMEFKYTRIKWRLKGTHVMSFGKKAKWLHSGCTVVAQWLHSGCTVVAQWLHSGRGVDSSRYALLSYISIPSVG